MRSGVLEENVHTKVRRVGGGRRRELVVGSLGKQKRALRKSQTRGRQEEGMGDGNRPTQRTSYGQRNWW